MKFQTIDIALNKLINNLPVVSVPFSFSNITDVYKNIVIKPYSVFMQEKQLTYQEVLNIFNSKDAYVIYNANINKYLIFFNDIDRSFMRSNRYRFSIAHELGHIFLEHLLDERFAYLRSDLSEEEYKCYERQADKFAIKLLCPFISFKYFDITSSKDIEQIYQISGQSAEIAYENYQIWLSNRNITNIKHLKYQKIVKNKFDLSVYQKFKNNIPVIDNTLKLKVAY